MKCPARVTDQPLADLGVLVGGVVVGDGMDELAGWHGRLDCVEEADEFLMPVLLHAATDNLAVEHVEGCKQGGGALMAPLISLWRYMEEKNLTEGAEFAERLEPARLTFEL